ncbi:hypothetical protein HanPI659440_Chr05g0215191 [Helianthus annuus]|nr:hypothetical protein HanPI659440_Chr05g0215191 [Helianthus annuus]
MHLQGREWAAKGPNKGSLMMLEPLLNLMVFSRQPWCIVLISHDCWEHLFCNYHLFFALGALTGALIGQERENGCVSCCIWSHFGCGYFD